MLSTLLTDGSSDTVLLPVLRWLLGRLTPEGVELRWADLRGLPHPPRDLRDRVTKALDLYPCTLLFVHRDAERDPAAHRYEEIRLAAADVLSHVGIVPVRMQEAWMLLDEAALREAAGRPSGRIPLDLPRLAYVESVPDPKRVLHDALRTASETKGRRAKRFSPERAAHRLAELIDEWLPLRQLSAFQRLESDTRSALSALGLPLHLHD